jgi:ankyrin repeat protein
LLSHGVNLRKFGPGALVAALSPIISTKYGEYVYNKHGLNYPLLDLLSENEYNQFDQDHGLDILHDVIRDGGNMEAVEFLVNRGARVHSIPDKNGCTILHTALKTTSPNRIAIVEFLLQRGADYTVEGGLFSSTILELPIMGIRFFKKEDLKLFNLILDKPSQTNRSNLSVHIISMLIMIGADDALVLHALGKRCDINSWSVYENSLSRAAANRFHRYVTPLMAAVTRRRYNLAKELIKRGADVNFCIKNLRFFYFPRNALESTIKYFDTTRSSVSPLTFVELLLRNGADVNPPVQPGTGSVLQLAAHLGLLDVACLLLNFGAKVNHSSGLSFDSPVLRCSPIVPGSRSQLALDFAAAESRINMV